MGDHDELLLDEVRGCCRLLPTPHTRPVTAALPIRKTAHVPAERFKLECRTLPALAWGLTMDPMDPAQRLSQIATRWSVLLQNHDEPVAGGDDARKRLLLDYYGAVYRYLLGAVRDPDTAAELAQEFALRFLRGAFRHAEPGRGRFRDYVKAVLINLVNDFRSARLATSQPLPADPVAAGPAGDDPEPDFVANWRAELLARTWQAFASAHPVHH